MVSKAGILYFKIVLKMETGHDFIVIRFYPATKGLYVKWLSGNEALSMLDFKGALEIILN
jgi:hypothetical protein